MESKAGEATTQKRRWADEEDDVDDVGDALRRWLAGDDAINYSASTLQERGKESAKEHEVRESEREEQRDVIQCSKAMGVAAAPASSAASSRDVFGGERETGGPRRAIECKRGEVKEVVRPPT